MVSLKSSTRCSITPSYLISPKYRTSSIIVLSSYIASEVGLMYLQCVLLMEFPGGETLLLYSAEGESGLDSISLGLW